MTNTPSLTELELNKEALLHAQNELEVLNKREQDLKILIEELEQASCNWVFETHEDAEDCIQNYYEDLASNACEGSYSYGNDEYNQCYTLVTSDVVYIGTLSVEYNRHDKQYYYIDGTDYSYKQAE